MFFVSYIWGDVYFISRGVGEEIGFFFVFIRNRIFVFEVGRGEI